MLVIIFFLFIFFSFRVIVEIGWKPAIAVTVTLVDTHMELSHEARVLISVGKMICFYSVVQVVILCLEFKDHFCIKTAIPGIFLFCLLNFLV